MEIKGRKGGVLVTLDPGAWFPQKDALITKIQTQERFFKGGKIAVDVGSIDLSVDEIEDFIRELSDEGVYLWAVLSRSEMTQKAALKLGILSEIEQNDHRKMKITVKKTDWVENWIERNLEDGEKVLTEGNTFVRGDLEKGAVIISSGSVFVWGSLKGSVHAGCDGNMDARVGSLRFQPEEIKIADYRFESKKKIDIRKPAEAFIQNNHIVIEVFRSNKLVN